MDTIVRNVSEISSDERQVYEKALGRKLGENQRVTIKVENAPETISAESPLTSPSDETLPDWVTIFADVPDDEMAEIEALILDRSEGRST